MSVFMQLFFRDIVVRPRESVSVGSLSLLLDFLPKVHGERGHGVGGQDDDGAAHELRGDAAPGREPHALPVQVRVCRLHGVREGLHASGREGALHFLLFFRLCCCGALPSPLTPAKFICLDKDVKSLRLRRVPGGHQELVLSGHCQD